METLVGRLTAMAIVNTTKGGKQVVNFSVAVNDSYKSKDSETKKIARYFKCAYWINPGLAEYLTKGALVELTGRIGFDVWKDQQCEPRATLTMHVNNIKLHGKNSKTDNKETPVTEPAASTVTDDLPF